jgi:hypothetical protein
VYHRVAKSAGNHNNFAYFRLFSDTTVETVEMKPMNFKILSILIASFVLWTIITYVGNKSATNGKSVETSENTSESADSISFPFYDSKSALKFVRENLLPPSELDYKLASPDNTDYTQYSDFPKIFKNYLKSKRNGFFIEVSKDDYCRFYLESY